MAWLTDTDVITGGVLNNVNKVVLEERNYLARKVAYRTLEAPVLYRGWWTDSVPYWYVRVAKDQRVEYRAMDETAADAVVALLVAALADSVVKHHQDSGCFLVTCRLTEYTGDWILSDPYGE